MTEDPITAENGRGDGSSFARSITAHEFGRAYKLGIAARHPVAAAGAAAEGNSAAARIEKHRLDTVRKTAARLKALRLAAIPEAPAHQ